MRTAASVETERVGERSCNPLGAWVGIQHGDPAVWCARHGDDAVALHRHARDPLVVEDLRHHEIGAVEHRRVGAEVHLEREVRTVLGKDNRRVGGQRGFGVDHDGQRVVVDDDELGRVDGLARVSATTAAMTSPTKRTVPRASGGRLKTGGSIAKP